MVGRKIRTISTRARARAPFPTQARDCLIWGKINGEAAGSSGNRKYEGFFVGTLQQFKNQGKSEKNSGP
jgi:hypothetical protein